ncbi:MAG: transporter substrate-binding domain-containing protein, partial [Spirochaetes bacterium]|nr:transporter substrate-binding domain-containing protein [Spirochaetota bacterium]
MVIFPIILYIIIMYKKISLAVLITFFLFSCSQKNQDILTDEERAWLVEHDGKIRLVPSLTYPPVDFLDSDGIQKGITTDIIRLIEKKLNFRVKRVYFKTWNRMVNALKTQEADLIGSIQNTPERQEFLNFTSPYITLPNVIIVKKEIQES